MRQEDNSWAFTLCYLWGKIAVSLRFSSVFSCCPFLCDFLVLFKGSMVDENGKPF